MLVRFASICVAISLGAASAHAGNSDRSQPVTRDDAREIIGDVQKIVSPNGIDTLSLVPIDGTDQWITVRGRDRRNPILLFVHGGPAAPEMPTSWTFQNPWEDYFTVVQWDQRGAGKSYNANDPARVRPTLTVSQMYADTETMVRYLRATYHTEKVFVLGHSWGSILGLMLAQKRPEWLYAYVGMGQLINGRENEASSYAAVLAQAQASGNDDAVKKLRALAPYPGPSGPSQVEKILAERKWATYFDDLAYKRSSYDFYFRAGKLSPDYSDADNDAIEKGAALTLPQLDPGFYDADFESTTHFDCPIVLFEGRHDETVPSQIAARWFSRVVAPSKKIVWFENSAHEIQIEEPGHVLVHLVHDVLPYADDAH